MPSTMTDAERDAFMLKPHLGYLGIGRVAKGPLLAPIWYSYDPTGAAERWTEGSELNPRLSNPSDTVGIQINMGATSAKAKRLRVEGRASMLVVEVANGTYSSVLVEGPVSMRTLDADTESSMLAMSSRYLGLKGGKRYTDDFMQKLAENDFPDGHGDTEIVVTITPETWRTEILP